MLTRTEDPLDALILRAEAIVNGSQQRKDVCRELELLATQMTGWRLQVKFADSLRGGQALGTYQHSTKTIRLDRELLNYPDLLAEIFFHECAHAMHPYATGEAAERRIEKIAAKARADLILALAKEGRTVGQFLGI